MQNSSDSSGLLIRKITDKGHNEETVIDASITAQSFILNGQDISDSISTQNIEQQLLKTLSSQGQLTQALKERSISLQSLTANNQQWDETITTLSAVGRLIVTAVVSYFTAGMGSGLVEAGNQAVQLAIDRAVNSMINQAVIQMADSAITGNSLNFDIESMLITSLTAGASAYVSSTLITPNTADALTQDMGIDDYAKNAAIKGTFEGVKSELAGDDFEDGFKTGAVISIMSDGALQMRKNVIDNYDYAGKDGNPVDEKVQSAGVRGDGKKIAGSHPFLSSDNEKIEIEAPFGGSQMGERKIAGQAYDKDGLVDNTLESFAGPHDSMSSWNYENIDGKTYLKNDSLVIDAASGLLLIPAAPFAAAPVIQENLDAIQILKNDIKEDKQTIEEFKRKNRSNP